jgi:branched-chain amino acid transport system permease protein
MVTFTQLLVSGAAMGFIYGLVAVGLTLIWNTTSMISFANDKVILLSSYLFAIVFMVYFGVVISSVATLLAIGAFGILIGIIIFIPLRHKDHLTSIMATIMLGKAISEIVRLAFGATALTLKGFLAGQIRIGEIVTARAYVYIIIFGILVAVLLQLLISFTKAGKAMTCVSINPVAASLMGVNVKRYMRLASGISFVIGAIVGILIIPLFDLSLNMTMMIGLKGFAAAVVGGFGSLPGALAGGILVGVVENYGGFLISAGYKDAIAFVLLIIFLLINPTGLSGIFGKNRSKKLRLDIPSGKQARARAEHAETEKEGSA